MTKSIPIDIRISLQKWSTTIGLAFFLFSVLSQPLNGQQEKLLPFFRYLAPNSKTQINTSSVWKGYSSRGIRSLRISVFNGGDSAKTYQLMVKGDSPRSTGYRRIDDEDFHPWHVVTATGEAVQVDPAVTAVVSLQLPNVMTLVDSVYLIVNDTRLPLNDLGIDHLTGPILQPSNIENNSVGVLISPDHDIRKITDGMESSSEIDSVNSFSPRYSYGFSSYSGIQNVELVRAPNQSSYWGDDYKFYSPFALVVITEDFYLQLPTEVKGALRDYVLGGGKLIISKTTELPSEFASADRGIAHKTIEPGIPIPRRRRASLARSFYFSFGLGKVYLSKESLEEWKVDPDFRRETDSWVRLLRQSSDDSFYRSAARTTRFNLVDDITLSPTVIFWSVFFFVILVGPINYVFVRRRYPNMMPLVFTTPLISLVITLLFVVGDYLSQGVTPITRLRSITILDQTQKREITKGLFGIYAPIRSGPLRFDKSTEWIPLTMNQDSPQGGHLSEDDQSQFLNGWIRSRTETYFSTRQVNRTDLRIDFQKTDEGMKATNGVGVDLVKLVYRAENGEFFEVKNVDAGATVVMESKGFNYYPKLSRFEQIPLTISEMILADPPAVEPRTRQIEMGKEHYLAWTKTSAFFEDPVVGSIRKPDNSFIYGIAEEQEK